MIALQLQAHLEVKKLNTGAKQDCYVNASNGYYLRKLLAGSSETVFQEMVWTLKR
jgi:hypothetical protein